MNSIALVVSVCTIVLSHTHLHTHTHLVVVVVVFNVWSLQHGIKVTFHVLALSLLQLSTIACYLLSYLISALLSYLFAPISRNQYSARIDSRNVQILLVSCYVAFISGTNTIGPIECWFIITFMHSFIYTSLTLDYHNQLRKAYNVHTLCIKRCLPHVKYRKNGYF